MEKKSQASTKSSDKSSEVTANFAYKGLLLSCGWICFAFGFIGAFIPLLPTTPFMLLAAYFFSKSSPRVHSWLTRLPYCGDAIIDWERNRVIRPRAKVLAVLVMAIVFTYSIFFSHLHLGLKILLVCIWMSCTGFILTRKSHP